MGHLWRFDADECVLDENHKGTEHVLSSQIHLGVNTPTSRPFFRCGEQGSGPQALVETRFRHTTNFVAAKVNPCAETSQLLSQLLPRSSLITVRTSCGRTGKLTLCEWGDTAAGYKLFRT